MNPSSSAQFSNNPSFNFLPPNPNLNPNLLHSQLPPPPPPPDLSATLSTLKTLIHHSHKTLDSLSTLLPPPKKPNNSLIPCPFNPHHLIPPPSLFLHSLHCHSSPYPNPIDTQFLLHSLHYPRTLLSSHHQTRFIQPFPDSNSNSDLCFSLDDYPNFSSNFFYSDCPAAITSSSLNNTNRIFTLPGVLSVECANFVGDGSGNGSGGGSEGIGKECFGILPSELLAIRGETERWSDYSNVYECSYSVLRAVLGVGMVRECDLVNWVIANSPRYGVVIDVAMRDHVFLLVRLCLKAIVREGHNLVERGGSVMSRSFKCPVLVEALMWLGSQLSILYGEINGKLFAIHLFKQCVLEAASGLLIFELEKMVKEGSRNLDVGSSDIRDVKIEESENCGLDGTAEGTVTSKVIFVSQVAAAVAALHERSLLEEKIKGSWASLSLPKEQRMAECVYVSQRADEERKKRSNYRPIIEHDGLPRLLSSNQESNKNKTREELLAEERDYKRRRMSYRGKKVKRTTLQVTRDIIEGYMKEIKQAGGIGCFVKGTEEGEMLTPELPSGHDVTASIDEPGKGGYVVNRKQSHSDYNSRSTSYKDTSSKDYEQLGRGLHGRHEYGGQRSVSRNKYDREYHSKSPERYRSHGQLHEWRSHQREQDDLEVTRTMRHEIKQPSSGISSISKYHDARSSLSLSNSVKDSRKDEQKSKVKDRQRSNSYINHSSDFLVQNAFMDRYDPSESHGMYKDDVSAGSKYVRPDKLSVREFHEQRSSYAAKKHYPDNDDNS